MATEISDLSHRRLEQDRAALQHSRVEQLKFGRPKLRNVTPP
jgi:hypothetical protein